MIYQGDCLDVMPTLPAESADSVVTDPPYGLGFMGKDWDHGVPGEHFWAEALRVAKPGAYLLAFGGTRTYHRLTCAIEDAGWEIRDCLMWVYGSGFPKSLNVSKAIDRAKRRDYVIAAVELGLNIPGNNLHDWTKAEHSPGDKWWEEFKQFLTSEQWGAIERSVIGKDDKGRAIFGGCDGEYDITAPATEAASQWQGWGTALKPAWEPIILARKPPIGTVAANVQAHGAGALNIDGCLTDTGRWPANLIHDGSDEVLAAFPQAPGQIADASSSSSRKTQNTYGAMKRGNEASADSENDGAVGFKVKPGARRLDAGSAARFFYCAKASKKDRNEGCESLDDAILARSCQAQAEAARGNVVEAEDGAYNNGRICKNNHPTVKPTDLMRYLCRLVTPPGGLILDPFMGSGSTGKAAVLEGFRFIGIEEDKEGHGYIEIARARIAFATKTANAEKENDYSPEQLGMVLV